MKIKEGVLPQNKELNTVEIELHNTKLILIEGYNAFAMCGALDVSIYNTERMLPRKVVCMKSVGVKTIDELYNSQIYESSIAAQELGITKGMYVKDAFKILSTQ